METGNGKMREHYTRIWTWIGIPGLIVALCAGNREEELTKEHINRAIGLQIVWAIVFVLIFINVIITCIPYVGLVVGGLFGFVYQAANIYCIVTMIIGIVKASKDQATPNLWPFTLFNFLK